MRLFSALLAVILVTCTVHTSNKTGVCISPYTAATNCDDFQQLTSPVWYYNWQINSTFYKMQCKSNDLRNAEFVPQIWGWYNQTLTVHSVPPGTKAILGFNEPNFKAQSNLQPADAVQGWKVIQSVFPNMTLVSPSASPCSGSQCIPNYGTQIEWFDEFFALCNGTCKVDYLAVHYYYCHPYDLLGSLQQLYDLYGLKIWLTEFNCPGGNLTQQTQFMQQVIPLMEQQDWIVRYAWFMDRESTNAPEVLLNSNASKATLTKLGKTFNSF